MLKVIRYPVRAWLTLQSQCRYNCWFSEWWTHSPTEIKAEMNRLAALEE